MESTVEMPLLSARIAALVDLLRDLRRIEKNMRDPENWSRIGICTRVNDRVLLRRLFPLWPKYSGLHNFPVPSADADGDPCDAYMEADSAEMWNRKTSRYAALRWELLEFLIETLEREIDRRCVHGN
jgi:hypothetical protein